VYECHGNSEFWQCCRPQCAAELAEAASTMGDAACAGGRWRAPPGFRFDVDPETRVAEDGAPSLAATAAVGTQQPYDAEAFERNWPRCVRCGGVARPSILMFGDGAWVEDGVALDRWEAWREALVALAPPKGYRVVVLEVGCGGNVTTVRMGSEDLVRELRSAGACATLVRINPELPLADDETLQPATLSILSTGLAAVRAIDEHMRQPAAYASPFDGYAPFHRVPSHTAGAGEGGDELAHEGADWGRGSAGGGTCGGVPAVEEGTPFSFDRDSAASPSLSAARLADERDLDERLVKLRQAREVIASADRLVDSLEDSLESSSSAWERFAAYPSVLAARQQSVPEADVVGSALETRADARAPPSAQAQEVD
jgi:hypothetical protein